MWTTAKENIWIISTGTIIKDVAEDNFNWPSFWIHWASGFVLFSVTTLSLNFHFCRVFWGGDVLCVLKVLHGYAIQYGGEKEGKRMLESLLKISLWWFLAATLLICPPTPTFTRRALLSRDKTVSFNMLPIEEWLHQHGVNGVNKIKYEIMNNSKTFFNHVYIPPILKLYYKLPCKY